MFNTVQDFFLDVSHITQEFHDFSKNFKTFQILISHAAMHKFCACLRTSIIYIEIMNNEQTKN